MMKLTISRTVQQKGIFRKVTVFYLNVDIDVSSEGMALLEKERWQYEPVYSGQREGRFYHSDGRERSLATVSLKWPDVVGKRTRWGFETLGELGMFESQLIFNMKKLKQRLGELAIQKRQQIEGAKRAKQAEADFTSEGPHEVEL